MVTSLVSPGGAGVDREHQLQLDFLARCRRRRGGGLLPIYDDRHLSARRSGTRTRLVSSPASPGAGGGRRLR